MRKRKLHFYVIGVFVALVLTGIIFSVIPKNESGELRQRDLTALSADAYIYGYPLVTMEMTRRVMTNVVKATEGQAPMGQFANMRQYPKPSAKEVTAPNADTLYSLAWVDLAKEPYIFHIPDEQDRYFLMPLLSGWTNVIADPGKRVGTKETNFVIIGPDWQGELPAELTKIKSPTDLIWILGRTYSTGTPADYAAVHAIQDEYKLIPLSAYGNKDYIPPNGVVDPTIDMSTPARKQVNTMDADHYFSLLASLLKENPPALEDSDMVKKLAALGIHPGQDFDITKVDAEVAKALKRGIKVAQQRMLNQLKESGKKINGWMLFTETGRYGTNYLKRAVITAVGLGANLPQDALYPEAKVDIDGNTLNGEQKYVMHFEKDKLPPVKGFWSLTMYDTHYFFVENSINRYNLSSRDNFKTNADGSVDFYIQHESPGVDKESNWLPAPAGDFTLMFRFYWPEKTIINGTWNPPPIQKIK